MQDLFVLVGISCPSANLTVRQHITNQRVVVVTDPSAFATDVSVADCGVAHLTRLEGEWLTMLQSIPSSRHVIVITDLHHSSVRNLNGLNVGAVLDLGELQLLDDAIRQCARRSYLEIVDEACRDMPSDLREIVRKVLFAVPPFRSVKQLARALECDRRTVWNRVRGRSGCGVHVKDILDHVLLIRASRLVEDGFTWRDAAAATKVSDERLARCARRLGYRRLRDIPHQGALLIAEALAARLAVQDESAEQRTDDTPG